VPSKCVLINGFIILLFNIWNKHKDKKQVIKDLILNKLQTYNDAKIYMHSKTPISKKKLIDIYGKINKPYVKNYK
jgi:hypothetical protein